MLHDFDSVWTYARAKEQELLRKAEQERLVRTLTGGEHTTINRAFQRAAGLLDKVAVSIHRLGESKRQSSTQQIACC